MPQPTPRVTPPQKQGHSLLGGSGANRWFACPGSIRLCRSLPPSPRTPYALEGSCAHHLAAICLLSRRDAVDYLDTAQLLPADPPEAEVSYTPDEEMCTHVQTYLDIIRGFGGEPGAVLGVEIQYDYGWLAPDMWGTADAVIHSPERLRVIDFKYGRGHEVEAEDNPQILLYAVGAVRSIRAAGVSLPPIIEVGIVQPRTAGPAYISEEISLEDLMLWVKHTLRPRVVATQDPNAPLRPGDWCRWCPARNAGCTAHLQQLEARVPAVASARAGRELPRPELLSKEELGIVVRAISQIDDWITGVKAYATGLLESGQQIPGCKLVPKRAMRYWIDQDQAAKDLKDMGVDPWSSKIITPAEAERRAKKLGLTPQDLEPLIEKKSNGYNLATDDDPRPRVTPVSQAEIAFKDVLVPEVSSVETPDPLAGLFE